MSPAHLIFSGVTFEKKLNITFRIKNSKRWVTAEENKIQKLSFFLDDDDDLEKGEICDITQRWKNGLVLYIIIELQRESIFKAIM